MLSYLCCCDAASAYAICEPLALPFWTGATVDSLRLSSVTGVGAVLLSLQYAGGAISGWVGLSWLARIALSRLLGTTLRCLRTLSTMSGVTKAEGDTGPGLTGPGLIGPGLIGPGLIGPGLIGPRLIMPGLIGPGLIGPGLCGPGFFGPGLIGLGLFGRRLIWPLLICTFLGGSCSGDEGWMARLTGVTPVACGR